MQIIAVDDTNASEVVERAVEVLRAGGLVIFPTETTYGAGVLATDQAAVDKLLAYKARREGKPLSIAVADEAMAAQYVELNAQARALYRQFLPGPVTVVSKSRGTVADGVASEFGTLGVRIPDHQLVLDMVKALQAPITATSANGSGEKRPYTVADILNNLSEKQKGLIDLIIDAGTLPSNPPSTVIDTTLSTPVTLRQGDVKLPISDNADQHITLLSQTEAETQRIAGQLLLKYWDDLQTKPIVIALDGPLGAGKTVFTKGVASFLQISEPITSPTYTYVEEYPFTRHQTVGNLYHFDMWKVEGDEQIGLLELPTLIAPNNVLVIEWWSQVAGYLQPLLQGKVTLIHCQLSEVSAGSSQRQILINE